jgi:hypothetical protein
MNHLTGIIVRRWLLACLVRLEPFVYRPSGHRIIGVAQKTRDNQYKRLKFIKLSSLKYVADLGDLACCRRLAHRIVDFGNSVEKINNLNTDN